MKRINNKGIALVIALLVIVVLMILGGVLILRSVAEKRSAEAEKKLIQAFYIGEAGANEALNRLDVLINTDLLNTVNQTNPLNMAKAAANYVAQSDGLGGFGLLVNYTKEGGVVQFTCGASPCSNTNPAVYYGATTNLGTGNYVYTINVTEKIPPGPSVVTTDVWDFPYNFTVSSIGTVGGSSKRKIILTGDFTVRVQKDNFARYALFTNHHGMPLPGGETAPVWFTGFTNFSGPLHTNGQFNFAKNPSGTFDGLVTQHEPKARFYNNGSYKTENSDRYPIGCTGAACTDLPTFNAGFQRGVDLINLESAYGQSDMEDEAKGGQNFSDDGIYLPNGGGSLAGGIYVRGAYSTVKMEVDANNNAKYTISRLDKDVEDGGVEVEKKYITVDRTIIPAHPAPTTTVQTVVGGSGTVTYNGIPDGQSDVGTLIYTTGKIDSMQGTVQKDTELTIASQNDMIITQNIMYEDYNPAVGTPGTPGYVPPNAEDKTNLLGLVCWGGNVRIGKTAPNNINIHSTVLARNAKGVFTVDGYDSGDARGAATLLGGAITDFYGPFGQFKSSDGTLAHGYARNFVYDSRMAAGKSPPYFPSMRTFIAFTNDITDKINWQEGGI